MSSAAHGNYLLQQCVFINYLHIKDWPSYVLLD